jgi:hypothetical protein
MNAKDDEGVRALLVFVWASIWEPLIVGTGGETYDDVFSNVRLSETKNSFQRIDEKD